MIRFSLPKSEFVRLEVYDIIGQKIETLINQQMQAGDHEIEFEAQNMPSGVYLYKIKAGEWTDMKKMVFLN